ncbi:hypothetical protein RJ641_011921 [Dillenia turbinata]|uniref:BHLH domain-containing protein n=1 Tax=Dillenia turbinata TaxID=194707 RepID=A0AAN8UVF5_9MAGN
MAEECTEGSVATSSSTHNNWWDLHANSLSSWSNTNHWHPPNPNSNSSCDDDVSISTSFTTNASNQSGLSVDSTRRLVEPCSSSNELLGESATDNQLWSQVLLSNGELQGSHDVGAANSLPNTLSLKNISSGMFEPACDSLKKIDNSWEFTSSTSFSTIEKHLNGFSESLIESERFNKLSNLVSNWSIAPPCNPQFNTRACNYISLNTCMDNQPAFCHMKQSLSNSSPSVSALTNKNPSLMSHSPKLEAPEQQEVEIPTTLFRRPFSCSNGFGYQIGLNNSILGENSKFYQGTVMDPPSSNLRSFSNLSYTGCLTKPLVDIHTSKPCLKSPNFSDCKKQGVPTCSQTRHNGRAQGIASEGKKKRTDNNTETMLKKPKLETTTAATSAKVQPPKVKITEKITTLQQIVSPFGKTDTASVLLEAISYIKFLQEQVQLLSNPYMKTNSSKDPWGALDRKDRGEMKHDLKSRGLCLVPISCTPQIYRENTGSDYWTPTYRGCLYR